jgi:hypothetical protein
MVAAKGFATGERTGIEVRVGVERVVDVELAVGAAEQTVTAEADAATLDAATSETGGVETGKAVRELPLNGRDWTTLAALEPGVSIVRTQNPVVLDVPRGNRGYGVMMSIGGSRPQQSSYWLDGINVNDYAGGAPASVLGASLGVDSVEEFSVITANPPVNYGKTSVGAVNAVTRADAEEGEKHALRKDPQNNAALRGRLKPGDRGLQCVCANRQAREVVDAIRVGDRIVDRAGIHTGHPELSAGYEGALPVYHTTRHRSNGNCLRM